jgi:hypothetical protein
MSERALEFGWSAGDQADYEASLEDAREEQRAHAMRQQRGPPRAEYEAPPPPGDFGAATPYPDVYAPPPPNDFGSDPPPPDFYAPPPPGGDLVSFAPPPADFYAPPPPQRPTTWL